jgi:hypothetical protein
MSEINPVEFGRLVGLVEALRADIADFKATHGVKMEDVGRQIEALATRVAAIEQFKAVVTVPTIADKAIDKALWGLLVAGLAAVFKVFS